MQRVCILHVFMATVDEVTVLLREISDGSQAAPERLMPLVYDELRKLSHGYLRNERQDHTLQPTALVHEAYLKLVDWENVTWQNQAHFFAVAATIMRNILVDHARSKKTYKRDGGQKLTLDEVVSFSAEREIDLMILDEALEELAQFDKTQTKIVELRFFGGLTIEETAYALKISPATVKREWVIARAWLFQKINNK